MSNLFPHRSCNNTSGFSCDKVIDCLNRQWTRYVSDQSTDLVNFCTATNKCVNEQLQNYSEEQTTLLTYFDDAVTTYLKTLTGYSDTSTLVLTTIADVLQWAVGGGGGGGTGTLTSVVAGDGMDFTTITTTGDVTLGTPSSVTLASTNSLTATSHTHAFAPGGTSLQYIAGDGTLVTFPSPTVTGADNGLSLSGTTVELGGALIQPTTISGSSTNFVTFSGADIVVNSHSIGRGLGNALSNFRAGFSALGSNTTGTNSVAVGYNALGSNTTGGNNTAVGNQAMVFNTTGTRTVAIGVNAQSVNSAGYNVAVGYGSLANNTAAENTAVGLSSLAANTSGTPNSAFGMNALLSNTTGVSNTGIGSRALSANTTGGNNTAVGYFALSGNTSSSDNTAVGVSALAGSNTGTFNTAVGRSALAANTSGTANAAFGMNALLVNTTAIKNTAIGAGAMEATTTGGFNVAVGEDAMLHNIDGTNNIAIGWLAGALATSGNSNISIGFDAGTSFTSGDDNIWIGRVAGTGGGQAAAVSGSIALGTGIVTTASNQMILGHSSITQTLIKGAVVTAPSYFYGETAAGLLTKRTPAEVLADIGAGTGTVASVSGTSNRITSTGGTTPVIDIAATYVGQTSITTLGTVTTGTLSTGAVIAGVTMTLGSDAANDMYYRNGSGVLTRLANGTTGQLLTATTASAPSWVSPASVTTLYTGDGTLAGARTVTLDGNNLGFVNGATTLLNIKAGDGGVTINTPTGHYFEVSDDVDGIYMTVLAGSNIRIDNSDNRITLTSSNIYLASNLGGTSTGYVWTLTNTSTGAGTWTAASGSGTVNSGTQYRIAYYATTAAAVSEAAAITASRALISDANGVPTHSATTSTELGYVSGVTSAIQTQLNTKLSTITVGATTITSGTTTRIPFNDAGVYAEDSALTWDKTNNAIHADSINCGSASNSWLPFYGDGNFYFRSTIQCNSVIRDEASAWSISAGSGSFFNNGAFSITTPNTTAVTTASALALIGNSLTTGTGFYSESSTLTSGKMLHIAVTGTAAAASQTGAYISLSGANATGALTTYGLDVSNTHTGTSVNVGARFTASGGSSNMAAIFSGRIASGGVTSALADIDNGNGTLATGSIIVTTSAGTNQTGNFSTGAQGLVGSNVGSIYQVLSSSTVNSHVYIGGTGVTAVGAGLPGSILNIGAAALVEASSGNHPILASVIIRPPTITGAAATVTDGATLWIEGPTAGTVSGTNTAIQVLSGNVEFRNGNLSLGTAGNKLTITEGTNGRVGQTALVAGTKAITITGVTTSSRAFVTLVTPNTVTLTITYQAVCTADTLTIQANVAAGTINTADISTLNYFVLN